MRDRPSDLSLSKRADPAYLGAFKALLKRLLANVNASPKEPISVYLAGGAAMHLYTGIRISDDVDAVFSRKLLVPADTQVLYRDSQGKPRSLYFDPNYNESFALLHEDAHEDAMRLPLTGIKGVRILVLQPVDLAVSKLSRFAEIDRADILQLAKDGLITAKALRQRAGQALSGYVGNPAPLRTSLNLACRDIEALGRRLRTRFRTSRVGS